MRIAGCVFQMGETWPAFFMPEIMLIHQDVKKGRTVMTTRFMRDTPHAYFEMEMQQIPGFRPRASGMSVSRFSYAPSGCDCWNYLYQTGKETCGNLSDCGCLSERSVAGCVPFSRLLEQFAMEVAVSPFVARVSRMLAKNPPVFFLAGHRSRFDRIWENRGQDIEENAMCAAIYLLSADRFLWGKSVSAIESDRIRFQEIQIHGVDLDGYVLFHTARDLYEGTCRISLSELVDPELVSEDAFRLVLSAFLIRRYGVGILCAERRGIHE